MISGNDETKQITCINWKKYVNSSVNSEGRDVYSGIYLSIYVIKSPIQLVRQSHENLYENLPLCSVGAALYILFHTFKLNTYMTSTIQYVIRKTLELILFYFPFLNALPYIAIAYTEWLSEIIFAY